MTDGKSPWLIRILALLFALLLYYNANTASEPVNVSLTNLEAVAENIPINVTYNHEKYFVTGVDETVSVSLHSSNRILLDKESNAETRGFSVIMDLTKYGEGTYDVPLEIVGMPNSVKATISPSSLSVTIEKRESSMFKVEPAIDQKIYAAGYETSEVSVSPPEVKVSGSSASIQQVDRIMAGVSDKSSVKNNFTEKVTPYAVNKDGEMLDVVFEPDTVNVDVKISVPSKRVKVTAVQSGVVPKGIKDYTFSIKDDMVDLEGPKAVLDEINGIDLKIDVSNIRETLSSSYVVVVPKDVTVIPSTVFVTVKPNYVTNDTEKSDK